MYNNIIFDFAKSLMNDKKQYISSQLGNSKEIYHFYLNNQRYNRLKGDYYIIRSKKESSDLNYLTKDVTKILKIILKKYKIQKVLVIGLGNSNIPCDSLGKEVTDNIIATNQYNDFYTIPRVCVFNPETSNKTGIKSFSIIKLLVDLIRPDAIVIIDSLLTNDINSLNKTIEITDGGIIPGFYLKDSRLIDSETFHIPVISIGVSLAISINSNIFTSTLVAEYVKKYGIIIAKSLNKVFLST